MQEALEELKLKLTSAPVLACPDFEKSFAGETDASSVTVGVVPAQCKENGTFNPVQHASRTMNDAERKYSVAVEHLTGWPIATLTATSTAEEVVKFVEEEIIYSFSSPGMNISDNAACFTAAALENLMKKQWVECKTVLAYAPMSNGRAERMIGTLKR